MLKKFIGLIFLTSAFFSLVAYSCAAEAESLNLKNAFGENSLLQTAGRHAGYAEGITVDPIIRTIISVALSFLGVIFLILTIYAGYLWMMARGNEQQVEKAKSLLTEAIIGLIIVVSAYAISYFVIKKIGDNTLQSQGSTATDTAS